jgi:beta-galactosidase
MDANGKDLAFVTVRITDENGNLVPDADNLVHFELEGEGRIVGIGNGNPMSREPSKGMERRAFSGMCLAVIQSTGEKGNIILKAISSGLREGKIDLNSK